MRFDVVTLFPELFEVPLRTSILGRAAERGVLEFAVHDLREHGLGRHRSVDDQPYGGGAGMVMRPEPLFAAIAPLREAGALVVLLDPAGERLTDALARELAGDAAPGARLRPLRGDRRARAQLGRPRGEHRRLRADRRRAAGARRHRRGVAARARRDRGGVPARRLVRDRPAGVPAVHAPRAIRGLDVPAILRSGHHAEVERWRRREALRRTLRRRPDLLDTAPLGARTASPSTSCAPTRRPGSGAIAALPRPEGRCYTPPVAAALAVAFVTSHRSRARSSRASKPRIMPR